MSFRPARNYCWWRIRTTNRPGSCDTDCQALAGRALNDIEKPPSDYGEVACVPCLRCGSGCWRFSKRGLAAGLVDDGELAVRWWPATGCGGPRRTPGSPGRASRAAARTHTCQDPGGSVRCRGRRRRRVTEPEKSDPRGGTHLSCSAPAEFSSFMPMVVSRCRHASFSARSTVTSSYMSGRDCGANAT